MTPRRRPRPKISLWARFKYWLRYWQSPLQLRGSLIRLQDHHRHPLLTLLLMFIPYPSWPFPVLGPFSPHALIEDQKNNTGIIHTHFSNLHNLKTIPIWRMRDTPLRSIYQLYELHVADQYSLIGYETEYFFYQTNWKLREIPDPKDPDPLRYAIVACILEVLCESINWKLSLGLRRDGKHVYRERNKDPWPPFVPEELPDWTKNVAPIDKELLKLCVPPDMLDMEGNLVHEEGGKSPICARRNIITNTGWFYTV